MNKRKIILVRNISDENISYLLNLYALKIKKEYNDCDYEVISINNNETYQDVKEVPSLLLIKNNRIVKKICGFIFMNKIPKF